MKLKLLTAAIVAICFQSARSQHQIELTGAVGDSVENISDRILQRWAPHKVLLSVHIVSTGEFTECYFDLLTMSSELKTNPPNSYFRMTSGAPAVIYFGFEKNIKADGAQLSALLNISQEYLEPDDVIFNIHNNVWYAKFKGDKLVEFKEKLSPKQSRLFREFIQRQK